MKNLLALLVVILVFTACGKKDLSYVDRNISEYVPLKIGKYLTYRLDSLTFTRSGVETHAFYDVKYQTEDTLIDNLGRKAFRVVRYIRNLPNGTFRPDNTFIAVNAGKTYEFTENNLRYIKLSVPYKTERNWKGNSAIDVTSLGSDLQYLFNWDYKYDGIDIENKIGNFIFDSTMVVNQIDRTFNVPIQGTNTSNPTSIATKDFGQEIYAAGIGMVYRKFLHWEYQRSFNNNLGAYTDFSYGVTLTLKDYN
jgi:hypothetical protein